MDSAMDGMQPVGAEGAADRRGADAGGLQLSPDRVNHLGLCAVSGHKRKWLGHVAMVGAPAVPAQRAFATTQPKNRRGSPRGSTTRPGTVVIRLK
jgi:hypothetical protein